MTESWLLLWILLSATAYTLGRLIVLDSLFEEPRTAILDRLTTTEVDGERRVVHNHEIGWLQLPLWKQKVATLLTCPHCVCGWTSAGTVAVVDIGFEELSLPVLWWFGAWAGALTYWAIVDSEP